MKLVIAFNLESLERFLWIKMFQICNFKVRNTFSKYAKCKPQAVIGKQSQGCIIGFKKPRPQEKEKFHCVYGCKLRIGFDNFEIKSFEAGVIFQSKVTRAAVNVIWSRRRKKTTDAYETYGKWTFFISVE